MDGSALFLITFGAVVVMILVTVWAALVMEAGARPPGRQQEDARPAGEPGEPEAPRPSRLPVVHHSEPSGARATARSRP